MNGERGDGRVGVGGGQEESDLSAACCRGERHHDQGLSKLFQRGD